MTTTSTASAARSLTVSQCTAEYMALALGYITPETARMNVHLILLDAPLGRKADWNRQVNAALVQLADVTDDNTEWFIMQFCCIYLAYEV